MLPPLIAWHYFIYLLLTRRRFNVAQCLFPYAGLCSEASFTRALECSGAVFRHAEIQNLIHAFDGEKRGTVRWQTFLDALKKAYDMSNKEKSHGNRSRQCIGGREGYDSSPNALPRSSSRGKSPPSSYSLKSSSYYPNSKFNNPNGNSNYSNTSFPRKQPILLLLYSFITVKYSLFYTRPKYSLHRRKPNLG